MADAKREKAGGEQTHWVNFPRELVHPYTRTRDGKKREMASVEMPAGTQIFKVDLSGMKLQLRLTELQKEHLVNGDQPYVRFPLDPGNVILWDPEEKAEVPAQAGALARAVREAVEKTEKARAAKKPPEQPKKQKAKPYWSLDPCTEKQIAAIMNARDNGDLTERELREAPDFGDMTKGEASALITLASERKKVREEHGDKAAASGKATPSHAAGKTEKARAAEQQADVGNQELGHDPDDEDDLDFDERAAEAYDGGEAYDGESPEYFDRIYEENLAVYEDSFDGRNPAPEPVPATEDVPPIEAYADIDVMCADGPEEAPLQVGYMGMCEQKARTGAVKEPGKPPTPPKEAEKAARNEGLLWAEAGEFLRKGPR